MSFSTKSNNYKNTVKGLRKLTTGKLNEKRVVKTKKNLYLHLQDTEVEESNDNETSNDLTVQKSREKNSINFNDLPEDMIYLILGFLSFNTRVAILKNKYNKNYVKSKLEKIYKTVKGVNQIWKCAELARDLLESLLENESGIFHNFSTYSVTIFKKETNPEMYSVYYRENFTKIILAAIHHYSKIYKFGHYTNEKVIEYIEKIVLKIFSHLSIMK